MSVITDILKKINFMSQSRFESTTPSNDELYAVEVNLNNDRWDGELHPVYQSINTVNKKGDTIVYLDSIIPNDGYDYIAEFTLAAYHNGNTNYTTRVYTDEMGIASNWVTDDFPAVNCGTNNRQGYNTFILLLKGGNANRIVHKNNTGGAYSSNNVLRLNWYRRVGSNED